MYGLGNLGNKVTAFTVRAVNACAYLKKKHIPQDIISQFRRSSTSIGANCSKAVGAQSQADYYAKLHIAYKEALETEHWIEVLHEMHAIDDAAYESIQNDCVEICKILTVITKNVKANIDAKKK